MEELSEPMRPFRVMLKIDNVDTVPPYYHSGHYTQDAAQARCDVANKDADKLGIKSRYVVMPFVRAS